jgi:hypothetical protein
MALADELKKVPLFEDLNQRQLRKLAKQFRERSYGEGRTVVREASRDTPARRPFRRVGSDQRA